MQEKIKINMMVHHNSIYVNILYSVEWLHLFIYRVMLNSLPDILDNHTKNNT
jgi:hypothetical protein